VAALLLAAVARPIATDDVWWHLALGREFARGGPWLDADPLLFAASGPASNASWLADVALAQALAIGGFTGLRIAHVAWVAALLALAAGLLRREATSIRVAALAAAAFATLAAYRVFQLRPELATVLATLLLHALVLRPRAGPSPARIGACAIGMAVWANLHAGFLLGPILAGVALAGVAGAALATGAAPADRVRIRRLAAAALLGALATLANPSGFEPHLAWLRAGASTPGLAFLGDEWRPLALLAWPGPTGPPSRAEWLLAWALVAGTLASTAVAIAGWRERAAHSRAGGAPAGIDPALLALAWAALAAMSVAVRFLWLGIFPLLLLAQTASALRPRIRARAALAVLPALAGPALLAGFVWIGPWPRISDVLRSVPMARPYAAEKYFVDPIWLIRDAGLEGRLFTAYELGGFAGFWLAPRVQTLVNGSLNVAPATVEAYFAIRRRIGLARAESFPQLLDRLGLDLFLGTGMQDAGPGASPSTVAHLERTPGWIPIFRNATSAVYLRSVARNAANLRRVADHYAREGVPFDPELGFDPLRVIRARPDWAIAHRLIPEDFAALERESAAKDPRARVAALGRSASVLALLGACDAALEREAEIGRLDPLALDSRRREIVCLLRAGRFEQARARAIELGPRQDPDGLLRSTVALARSLAALPEDRAQARIRRLPLLTTAEAHEITRALHAPRVVE
jgi:hypothetical protein